MRARNRNGHVTIAIAFAALMVPLVTASAAPQQVAHIVYPGYGGGGIGLLQTTPGTPYTFNGLVICLDRPGRAVIDEILPIHPTGGLTVQAFAAGPNPFEVTNFMTWSEADKTIAQLRPTTADPHVYYTGAGNVVDHACPPDLDTRLSSPDATPVMKMLYIQYAKPTEATAGDEALGIVYTSGGLQFTMVIPWAVELCGPGDHRELCS